MTTDELEMRLRQLQLGNITDVKLAVLEPSGNLSVVPKEQKKGAEKQDIQTVINMIQELDKKINSIEGAKQVNFTPENIVSPTVDRLFEEARKEDKYDSNLPLH